MKYRFAPATLMLSLTLMSGTPVGAIEDKGAKEAAKDPKSGAAAKPSNPLELKFIPSTFVDSPSDPKIGKDIFFPKTTRLVAKPVDDSKNPTISNEAQVLKQIILKGISGNGHRRLAVLNNRTLATGETWEYKVNGQSHRIKLEEIKARSVLISIEGSTEKKELQLRDGL